MLRRFSLILIKYITCGIGWYKSIVKKSTNFPNDWIFARATPLPVFQKALGKKEEKEKGTGIHINFRRIHDLFVVSLISSQVCIKTPSVSGSRNRRQVKPRNKNRHSSWLFSFLLGSSSSRFSSSSFAAPQKGFSQQYGMMFDEPIDHGTLSVFRLKRWPVCA